jgi:hypothetical protein
MTNRDRMIKLELSVSEAVALYYAAGSLRDDIIYASGKTTSGPPVSGSRKTLASDCARKRPVKQTLHQ